MIDKFSLITCTGNPGTGVISSSCLPQASASSTTLNTIFLIIFSIIGAIAFLFLVIGGLRYITGGGNPESVQKAKNQIRYSLIGLVIAAMAATIVNYLLTNVLK